PHSIALKDRVFSQVRLPCHFRKGFLFYAEYNLRLFLFLLKTPCDAVCSIDLDTLPAGWLATVLRRKRRVFDAHEYFTQAPEVVGRPLVQAFWQGVARLCLPAYRHAYTVGPGLARIFQEKYGIPFGVVRNVPSSRPAGHAGGGKRAAAAGRLREGEKYLLYQGALNMGRGIEALLDALPGLQGVHLLLAGEGDLSAELRARAEALGIGGQLTFLGYVEPEELRDLTECAWLGLNLLENRGLSYYYSLANKFFDYVQAEVPVLTMDFPEYRALQAEHEVAVLLDRLEPAAIAAAIRDLLEQPARYAALRAHCCAARDLWCWEREKQVLLRIWAQALA
ncbi:MAG TPA: glycosyltransferase, partial [Saprospiraceae bacterium]|nr:glycosyltransferase [Saprospiraceae bacterium]